jgi:hypothetical protein
MLDTLDTETILLVLSFLSRPFRISASNTQALYVPCLVSKRLQACAQPLLWRGMIVKTADQVTALLCEAPRFRNAVRVVSNDMYTDFAAPYVSIFPLLKQFKKLEDVRIYNTHFNSARNALFPELARLPSWSAVPFIHEMQLTLSSAQIFIASFSTTSPLNLHTAPPAFRTSPRSP